MNFEAILEAEGLGVLEHDGRDWVKAAREPTEDEASAREMDLERLKTYRFRSRKDRELWRRHCEGQGYQKIARETRTPEKYVRCLFARISSGRLRGGLSDTGGLPEPKTRSQGPRRPRDRLRRAWQFASPETLMGLAVALLRAG